MTAELIFAADPDVWDPGLGRRVRSHVQAGRLIIWRSVSGTVLTLGRVAVGDGVSLVGIRNSTFAPFPTDGMPLEMGWVEATSCGMWALDGYRSSRPVTVHVLETADAADGAAVAADWQRVLRAVADEGDPLAWLRQVPAGHPAGPCPVAHCPIALNGAGTFD